MIMTQSREFSFVIPEIDDGLLIIEPNDAGGPPVLLFERISDDEIWVFNWRTGCYESAECVSIA